MSSTGDLLFRTSGVMKRHKKFVKLAHTGNPCVPGSPGCPRCPGGPGSPGGPSFPGIPGKPGCPSGPLSPDAPLSPGYTSNLHTTVSQPVSLPVLEVLDVPLVHALPVLPHYPQSAGLPCRLPLVVLERLGVQVVPAALVLQANHLYQDFQVNL